MLSSFLVQDKLLASAKLDLLLPCTWLRSEPTKFARPLEVVAEDYLVFAPNDATVADG